MSTLLEIRDLFGGYARGVDILQGVNLSVEAGEAVGIIGLNGSGKSTLGKAVMNLIPYRSGSIAFDGQPVETKIPHELSGMGIVVMHQGGVVFPNLSVWQNLMLATGKNTDRAYFAQLKEVIPLLMQPVHRLKRTMADKLSGGQRHELALAMTLARKPKLVILDEPSAGLSPIAVAQMYEMLAQIRKRFGVTMILIEQNVARAVEFCDKCLIIGQGDGVEEFDKCNRKEIECLMF